MPPTELGLLPLPSFPCMQIRCDLDGPLRVAYFSALRQADAIADVLGLPVVQEGI